METCCIFPNEMISHILRYSSPRDVVQWRAVSKWFCDITYDASIWKDLYTNSCLPRPPGPFPYQSTADLELALIRSEKLAQSWTTKPMRDVSSVELQIERRPPGPLKLLGGGRWLVGCESATRLVLHDVDTSAETRTPSKQVIWEQDDGIKSWDVSSLMTEDGQVIMYVLLNEIQSEALKRRLLEFRLNGQSGEPCGFTAFDVPTSGPEDLGAQTYLGRWESELPFLYVYKELVFDTRTRIFYRFPDLSIALDETSYEIEIHTDDIYRELDSVMLTSTHVIAFHKLLSFSAVLIQAFTVDEFSVKDGEGVLRLSHEGLSYNVHDSVTLLQNSIVDPITGSIEIKLLYDDFDNHHFICNNLILPKPTGDQVLQIAIVIDEKLANTQKPRGSDRGKLYYASCSEVGHLRGFYRTHYTDFASPPGHSKQYPVMKFAIDTTQDEGTLTFGEFMSPEWKHIEDPGDWTTFMVDVARGRLYFVKQVPGDYLSGYQRVVVVDVE